MFAYFWFYLYPLFYIDFDVLPINFFSLRLNSSDFENRVQSKRTFSKHIQAGVEKTRWNCMRPLTRFPNPSFFSRKFGKFTYDCVIVTSKFIVLLIEFRGFTYKLRCFAHEFRCFTLNFLRI